MYMLYHLCHMFIRTIMIYITAAFAIASGKKKHRCLIIAHLVLSIMGIIISFSFVGVSIYTFWLEVITRDDNVSFAIALVWFPFLSSCLSQSHGVVDCV
ncbi:hypothetical protein LSH36_970g00088 [Paralvinella palmiformis]|uniref:Uncharacterized protein n=1 Tax=Paralvinella palmiformis TaxID=53620 RepID=A0AAD9IX63_9ANNE|nr:hypothetical protein LSH36_970g00088 [Paralvinella palmiformis]